MTTLLLAVILVQEKTIVEGSVVNALTNESLKKAQVFLDSGKKTYSAITAPDGAFRIEGLEPGEYYPRVERQGFLDNNDLPELELSPSEHIKDLVLKLTPQGVIAGHVVDQDGDPIADASVNVERSVMIDGRKLVLESASDTTNGEGYFFVAGLKAGLYTISAAPQAERRRPWNPSVMEDFVRTEDPFPITLAAGAAVRDVQIKMKKSTVYRVRGTIANAPKESKSMTLSNESNSYKAWIRNGVFSFDSVPTGSYFLASSVVLFRPDDTFAPATLFCNLPVTVSDHDIDDLAVELRPGANVEGIIRIAGDTHFEKPPQIGLIAGFRMETITAKPDGTFGWTNLFPGLHPLDFWAPDGFYTKSIQFNRRPVSNSMLDLNAGGGTLEIVVAPNPATVIATGAKNFKIALWNDSRFDYQSPDKTGIVKFTRLAPGEYRIAAWQDVDDAYVRIPEFRARFDAQKITLTEGQIQNVEVKPIPKSVSDAEVAKLQ